MNQQQKFIHSLRCAVAGICDAVKTERHMRWHLCAAVLVVIAGLIKQLAVGQWLFVCSAIALVIICEMVNSAVESVVDLAVGDRIHPLAKRAKDIAAGATLLAACYAAIVGISIFLLS